MLKQSDVEGRLRLFRYGLLVIVVVAFLVSLVMFMTFQFAAQGNVDNPDAIPGLGDFLVQIILITAVVAVLGIGVYYGYRYLLLNQLAPGGDE